MEKVLTQTRTFNSELTGTRFCQRRRLDDSDKALIHCDAALFKVYLELRVKDSNIKKLSAVQGYWKRLSMIYAMKAQASMANSILYDIRNVCGGNSASGKS